MCLLLFIEIQYCFAIDWVDFYEKFESTLASMGERNHRILHIGRSLGLL